MKKAISPEDILQSQLLRCADSIAQRLDRADTTTSVDTQNCQLHAAVALLNASARLADALARLRGRTQTIHVTREGASPPDGGSNGK
jgi:hypothetical protein